MVDVRGALAESSRASARRFYDGIGNEGTPPASDEEVAQADLGGYWSRALELDAGEPVEVAGWELPEGDSLREWRQIDRICIAPDGTMRCLAERA